MTTSHHNIITPHQPGIQLSTFQFEFQKNSPQSQAGVRVMRQWLSPLHTQPGDHLLRRDTLTNVDVNGCQWMSMDVNGCAK